MSYILEALRKSERERQRNQALNGDLLVSGQAESGGGRRPWAVWAVVGVVALNLLSMAYFWGAGREQHKSISSHAISQDLAAVSKAAPAPEPVHEIAVAPIEAPPSGASAQQAVAAPPVRVEQKCCDSDTKPPSTANTKRREPASVARPPAVPSAAVKETKPAAAPPVAETPKTEPDAAARPAPVAAVEQASAQEASVQTPAVPAAEAQREAPVPLLQAMPPEFQAKIPALKISLHAYFSDPRKRFAVINMNRYEAGEQVADGVRLEEIKPDGLVLSFEDTRFRVNRP